MGRYLRKSLPPLLVITINTVIILLLDYTSVLESYDCHSSYQNTVYLKTVIYMIINLFVIPVLTLSNGGVTLYQLFMTNNWNLPRLLGELFIPKSGEFFIILLIQQGALSVITYLLNIPDIMASYFLPSLAYERRKIYND